MQNSYSIDKFRIHQAIVNREQPFCRIDLDGNIHPINLNEIAQICPASQNWGNIFVENLYFEGIPGVYAEFVEEDSTSQPINAMQ